MTIRELTLITSAMIKTEKKATSLTWTQFSVSCCRTVWRNTLDLQEFFTAAILAVITANNCKAETSRRLHKMCLNKLAPQFLWTTREAGVPISCI